MKRAKKPYVLAMILLLLSNTLFSTIASASMAGGGSSKRTVYGLNYDMKMNLYSSSDNSIAGVPVHAGGENYFRVMNTYPGTNKNTVKGSTYTVTVPDSIDFSSIDNFSLVGENGRVFTGGTANWLNSSYSAYLVDASLYTLSADIETRTITVTIPNTSDWTSINSTVLHSIRVHLCSSYKRRW